jgi:hypothetical protein
VNIGDTFLPGRVNDHLHIVISDPVLDADELVLVSLTSYDTFQHQCRKDGSCVLDRGDHPWITHTTCVSYRDGRVVAESKLDDLLRRGEIESREPVADQILTRILEGAEKTEELPNKCRSVLERQGLIQG